MREQWEILHSIIVRTFRSVSNLLYVNSRYHPGYFGKVGVPYFHRLRSKFTAPSSTSNASGPWSRRRPG
ncbi:hypothetical protein RJ640_010235 [Escallonia rubra]|uniref:Uncharacterized protein n=1 Tax=Escallonia rubra TaxID=112253 RepID=A0AA88QP59_9ASTE|nr:hypothetical protein RJ640_010235 [Escallonia rubra]